MSFPARAEGLVYIYIYIWEKVDFGKSDKMIKISGKLNYNCCGPVKGPEERHEFGFTWNKVY